MTMVMVSYYCDVITITVTSFTTGLLPPSGRLRAFGGRRLFTTVFLAAATAFSFWYVKQQPASRGKSTCAKTIS